MNRLNRSTQWGRALRTIALIALAAGTCAAQNITEITLPATRIFPESITSTADGTLIIGNCH